jgi:hypothetical protein
MSKMELWGFFPNANRYTGGALDRASGLHVLPFVCFVCFISFSAGGHWGIPFARCGILQLLFSWF